MKEIDKKPFEFEYTKPSLDWYEVVKVKIDWNDYLYFKLEYRYGPSLWLVGYIDKPARYSTHERVDIGELYNNDLVRFLDWCEYEYLPMCQNSKSSKLIGIEVISTEFNIIDKIKELVEQYDKHKNSAKGE